MLEWRMAAEPWSKPASANRCSEPTKACEGQVEVKLCGGRRSGRFCLCKSVPGGWVKSGKVTASLAHHPPLPRSEVWTTPSFIQVCLDCITAHTKQGLHKTAIRPRWESIDHHLWIWTDKTQINDLPLAAFAGQREAELELTDSMWSFRKFCDEYWRIKVWY